KFWRSWQVIYLSRRAIDCKYIATTRGHDHDDAHAVADSLGIVSRNAVCARNAEAVALSTAGKEGVAGSAGGGVVQVWSGARLRSFNSAATLSSVRRTRSAVEASIAPVSMKRSSPVSCSLMTGAALRAASVLPSTA